jgi:benzylsuccinate CoA-transferase BbsF subunit
MGNYIFDGIKALDMGTGGTVPLALKWLGDHGASVIKVETHLRLDSARMGGPFYGFIPGANRGGWQVWLNSTKYSFTVNLAKPQGRDLIKQLVVKWQPHILAESYRPGVMKKWGLDYDSIKKLKSDIIYWSSCIEGQYGPHCMRLGYGSVTSNLSGVGYLTGWPDRPPAGVPLAYSDFPAVGTGLIAITSALIRQRRTGKGVHLDQSQYESNLYVLAAPILEYLVNGRVMERNGNRLSHAAPHGVYPCEGVDRWVAIAVFTDEEWRSFCDVIGNPDWTKAPKFATLAGRKQSEDELDQLVGEWTKIHKAEDVESAMQARGVAANVVEDNQDIYEDPQMKYRGHFQEVEHPEVGKVKGELPPFRLSKSGERHFRAPLLGEHNNLILSEFLGLSDDEISDLYAEGAITTDADLPQPKKQ